jgi:hypothetical protein
MTWMAVESKMFSAVAYAASGKILYIRFRRGDVYRTSTFLPAITRPFSPLSRRDGSSSPKFAIASATSASPDFRPSDSPTRRPSPDGYAKTEPR